MIINNAGSRSDVEFWTGHLQSIEENTRAEMKQIRGLKADNLLDALLEMQREASARPRLKNFMYHADFNPCPHERLTEENWDRAFEIFEKQRGIPEGTPRIVYEHEKEGRIHRHAIWSRLNLETMRAFPDGLDAKVAHAAARKIEIELGLEKVIGPFDREPGTPRPERGLKPYEMYRGMKTKIDPRDMKAQVTALRQQSQTGREFQTALEMEGYELVTGDRGLLILDNAGKGHSLAKRCGMPMSEVMAFMRDVDLQALPTLKQAQDQYQQRKIAGLEADRATVRDEIQWEQALDRAALELEKIQPQFLAAEDREEQQRPQRETRAGALWEITATGSEKERAARAASIAEGQQRQAEEQQRQAELPPPTKPIAPELGRADAGIRLAYSLTGTGQEFANALEDRRVILAQMTEADASRLNKWEAQRLKELKELQEAFEAEKVLEEQQRQAAGLRAKAEASYERRTGDKNRYSLESYTQYADAREQTTARADEARQQEAAGKKPATETTRADAWMAQTGGYEKLSPELQEQAEASYDKWTGPKEKYGLADYVQYVQTREAERGAGAQQEKPQGKYKAGELVVVDAWGSVYQLNYRNTGDGGKARAARLKDIDRAALLSVTAAQSVMKKVQQHQNEEKQQARQQQRDDRDRAAQEKHWPTAPPQPERKSAVLFNQAGTDATRDNRTQDLTGTAAQIWKLWTRIDLEKHAAELGKDAAFSVKTDRKAFAVALDERGIGFAVATKDEADRSHREAELAKAAGNYATRFKEGEIVIVTAPRPEYRREGEIIEPRRVQRIDQSLATKFLDALGTPRHELKGIEATKTALVDRARERAAEWEGKRMEHATGKKRGGRDRAGRTPAAPNLAKAATRTIGGIVGGTLTKLADGFTLDALTPKEKYEAAKRDARNEREADTNADYAAYIASLAEAKKLEQQRQAEQKQEHEREHYGGGRER